MNADKEYCKHCEQLGHQVEIFNSGSISRCLRCSKPTEKEIPGKEYWELKQSGFLDTAQRLPIEDGKIVLDRGNTDHVRWDESNK